MSHTAIFVVSALMAFFTIMACTPVILDTYRVCLAITTTVHSHYTAVSAIVRRIARKCLTARFAEKVLRLAAKYGLRWVQRRINSKITGTIFRYLERNPPPIFWYGPIAIVVGLYLLGKVPEMALPIVEEPAVRVAISVMAGQTFAWSVVVAYLVAVEASWRLVETKDSHNFSFFLPFRTAVMCRVYCFFGLVPQGLATVIEKGPFGAGSLSTTGNNFAWGATIGQQLLDQVKLKERYQLLMARTRACWIWGYKNEIDLYCDTEHRFAVDFQYTNENRSDYTCIGYRCREEWYEKPGKPFGQRENGLVGRLVVYLVLCAWSCLRPLVQYPYEEIYRPARARVLPVLLALPSAARDALCSARKALSWSRSALGDAARFSLGAFAGFVGLVADGGAAVIVNGQVAFGFPPMGHPVLGLMVILSEITRRSIPSVLALLSPFAGFALFVLAELDTAANHAIPLLGPVGAAIALLVRDRMYAHLAVLAGSLAHRAVRFVLDCPAMIVDYCIACGRSMVLYAVACLVQRVLDSVPVVQMAIDAVISPSQRALLVLAMQAAYERETTIFRWAPVAASWLYGFTCTLFRMWVYVPRGLFCNLMDIQTACGSRGLGLILSWIVGFPVAALLAFVLFIELRPLVELAKALDMCDFRLNVTLVHALKTGHWNLAYRRYMTGVEYYQCAQYCVKFGVTQVTAVASSDRDSRGEVVYDLLAERRRDAYGRQAAIDENGRAFFCHRILVSAPTRPLFLPFTDELWRI